MQPSICARITSGLTGTPQSTAQTTRSTLIFPSRIDTSATCATNVSNDSCTAMPCATPARRGLPQPALSAASLSTPAARELLPSSARRNETGSRPPGDDRVADDYVLRERDAALRVEPALDRMNVHRPVQPCAGIVLAAELQ